MLVGVLMIALGPHLDVDDFHRAGPAVVSVAMTCSLQYRERPDRGTDRSSAPEAVTFVA